MTIGIIKGKVSNIDLIVCDPVLLLCEQRIHFLSRVDHYTASAFQVARTCQWDVNSTSNSHIRT
jgi:hypothetical protein